MVERLKRDNTKKTKIQITIDKETGSYTKKTLFYDKQFSDRGYIIKMNANYIKLFMSEQLPEECSISDCGKFYRLIMFLVGNNQLLGYRSTKKIKPLTIKKMSEILESSERQIKEFIKKMERLNVIKSVSIDDEKWFAVNPVYALKGKYISFATFTFFQEELINKLPEDIIKKFLNKYE